MVFDTTNSESSSESEEEKEKPLCRPESDEDLSVEYWHIQKLVDDLKVKGLISCIHILFSSLRGLNFKNKQGFGQLQVQVGHNW